MCKIQPCRYKKESTKLLQSKRYRQQNKEATNGMGDICKPQLQQGVNIQKEFNTKQTIQLKNWAEDLNRHLSQDIQMATDI